MEAEDKISSLPDEILFHIISSLPFESAIQTLLLSKRWTILWQKTLLQHGSDKEVSTAISNFLANFNEQHPSKNTRKFKFHFINSTNTLLAIIAPKNILHLYFSTSAQEIHREFKLELEFNPKNNITNVPSTLFFIKNLHLKSVSYLRSEAASSVITKFQFLETLKISNCSGLQCLRIGSDSKLVSLTIFDCLQLEFVHIRCFKLKTFRIRGIMPSILPQYHYNLDDAFLDFRKGPTSGSCDLDLLLLTIKNVKVLTLCKWTFQELICPSVSKFETEFQFYYIKELWWIENSEEEYDSEALVSFLKLCPSLERLFVTIDPKSYGAERRGRCSMKAGRKTKLKNLKVVKLDGFGNQKNEIHLAESLREIVSSEAMFLASADGICLKRMPETHPNYCYADVPLNYMKEICLKHLHMDL